MNVTSKNVVSRCTKNLKSSYMKARKKASKETLIPIKEFSDVMPDDWTIENLSNAIWIEKFLHEYAKHEDAIEYLDDPSRPKI